MAVTVRSSHRPGDLGQAFEGLAVQGEAFIEDHDPLGLALQALFLSRDGS